MQDKCRTTACLEEGAFAGYRSVGKCEHPIEVVDKNTGVVHFVRCGSRLAARCGSCSQIAKKDYQKIVSAGFGEVDASQYCFFFLTLTAPSFGRTHTVVKIGRQPKKCRCGVVHDPRADAGLRGIPIDMDSYDYEGCCEWNYRLGKLWDSTRASLSANFPRASFVKVVEYQSRGALHTHCLVRIPLREGVVSVSGARKILDVARSTVTRTGLAWGEQGDCTPIRQIAEQDKFVRYMAKMLTYVTKDSDVLHHEIPPQAAQHYSRLDWTARHMHCDKCRHMERPCLSLCHRRWGARSSVMSKSRQAKNHRAWSSVRRMDLRQRRIEFAQKAARLGVAIEALAILSAAKRERQQTEDYSPVLIE